MSKQEEIEYLLNIVNKVRYSKNRFKLMCGEEKYIFGVVSGTNMSEPALYPATNVISTFR